LDDAKKLLVVSVTLDFEDIEEKGFGFPRSNSFCGVGPFFSNHHCAFTL